MKILISAHYISVISMLYTVGLKNWGIAEIVFLLFTFHCCCGWNMSFTAKREQARDSSTARYTEVSFKCLDNEFQCKRTKKCINRDLVSFSHCTHQSFSDILQ